MTIVWALVGSALILAFTLVLLFKVLLPGAMRRGWGVLQSRFAAMPAAPGSQMSKFESVTVGGLRLGNGVSIQTDSAYLHLHPGGLGRMIGCRAISVPWREIVVGEAFVQGLTRVEIAGIRALVPTWCVAPGRAVNEASGESH